MHISDRSAEHPDTCNPVIVAIVGAECSGKSSLAEALGGYYGIPWLHEYARDYLTMRTADTPYDTEDLRRIGKEQWASEVRFLGQIRQADCKLAILDTDLLVIDVWWQLKYRQMNAWVQKQLQQQPPRYYLLTRPDIPWVADPLREAPEGREDIHRTYRRVLTMRNLNFAEISGSPEERLELATASIQAWQSNEHSR